MSRSPFFGIELFHFTPALEKRVLSVVEDQKRGELPTERVIGILLDIINGFLGALEGDAQVAPVLKELAGQRLAVEVEGVAAVTGTLTPGGQVRVEKGVRNGAPAIRFRDLDTFADLLTGRLDDAEALRSGRIQVRNMADLLKLLAPVVAIQSRRREEFQERIHEVVDRILRERGY